MPVRPWTGDDPAFDARRIEFSREIGRRLRFHMDRRGFKQEDFLRELRARLPGRVSARQLARYLSGVPEPGRKPYAIDSFLLREMAAVLGVTLADLQPEEGQSGEGSRRLPPADET